MSSDSIPKRRVASEFKVFWSTDRRSQPIERDVSHRTADRKGTRRIFNRSSEELILDGNSEITAILSDIEGAFKAEICAVAALLHGIGQTSEQGWHTKSRFFLN